MGSENSLFSIISALVGPLCPFVCLFVGVAVLIGKEKITKLLGIWYLSFGLYQLVNYLMLLGLRFYGVRTYENYIVLLDKVYVFCIYALFVILLIYSKLRYKIKYWVPVALLIVFGPIIYFSLGVLLTTNTAVVGLVFGIYLLIISVVFICIMISNIRKENKLKAAFLVPLSMVAFSMEKIIVFSERLIGISIDDQVNTSMVVLSIYDIMVIISAVYILCRGPKAEKRADNKEITR